MDGLGDAANIATIATGTAAVTAAMAWVRAQWTGWQAQRVARKRRNWHGYVDVGGIDTVPVRLAEPPKTAGAIITIEVLDKPDGKPDEQLAAGLRIAIQNYGFLSRPPTVAELDFLKFLRKRDGYNRRNVVIR
jgi:hypothetical protein